MSILSYTGSEFAISSRLTLYPGGEIRFRSYPSVPSKARDRNKDISLSEEVVTPLRVFNSLGFLIYSSPIPLVFLYILSFSPFALSLSQQGAQPPVEAPLVNRGEFHPTTFPFDETFSHSKAGKPGYGSLPVRITSFTRRARNTIRWAGSACEQFFGRDKCVFLTGTLPGSTSSAIETFARFSSWIMDRLQKWLRKSHAFMVFDSNLGRVVPRLFHLGCWELQRRGALHYHAMVVCEEPDELIATFHSYWCSLCESICRYTGVDIFARAVGGTWRNSLSCVRADAQVVRKSVSAYLAKYLGKGYHSSSLPGFPPVRWWACTRAAKELIDVYLMQVSLPPSTCETASDIDSFVGSALKDSCSFAAESLRSVPLISDEGLLGFQDVHSGWIGFVNGDWSRAQSLFSDLSSMISECALPDSRRRFDAIASLHSRLLFRRWYSDFGFSSSGFDMAALAADHYAYFSSLDEDVFSLIPDSEQAELEPSQLELFWECDTLENSTLHGLL